MKLEGERERRGSSSEAGSFFYGGVIFIRCFVTIGAMHMQILKEDYTIG